MANKYGEDIFDFIKANVQGKSNQELLELVNQKFGNIFTIKSLKAYKGKHKLSSGLTGRFEKGQTPQNKGKKMSPEIYEKVKRTMFKKGHCPHNHKPVESERINKQNNMIMIKVSEPNKWIYKQRHIWEQVNGKIPKGMVITFLNGNNRDFSIENLACITKNENCRLNINKTRSEFREVTQANIGIERLKAKIRKLKQI